MPSQFLTNLYSWSGPSDWKATLEEAFVKAGYSFSRNRAWSPQKTYQGTGALHFSIGWQIKRMGWGDNAPRLLLEPSRFAFKDPGSAPLSNPNLVGIEPFDRTPFLRELDTLVETLQEAGSRRFKLDRINATLDGTSAETLTRTDGTNGKSSVLSQSLGRFRKSLGRRKLLLIATGYDPTPHREIIIQRARNLHQSLSQAGNEVTLKYSLPTAQDITRIAEQPGHEETIPILLFFLPGTHGEEPPLESSDLLKRASELGIPFQLVSYQNDSAYADQSIAVAIHQKTGRPPFTVSGSRILDSDAPLLIGVDQAHPRGLRHSYLSIVALSPQGDLLARQHLRAPRDETLDARALSTALDQLREELGDKLSTERPVIVMRDGRRFPNEKWETWRKLSPLSHLTFLEIKKRPFPIIFRDPLKAPEPGSLFSITGSDDLFLYPICAKPNQIGHTLRIRASNNPNNYDPLSIAEMVTACCYMAGLGLHPSTRPSPIYWADGFAGLNEISLKFSGFSRLFCNRPSEGASND